VIASIIIFSRSFPSQPPDFCRHHGRCHGAPCEQRGFFRIAIEIFRLANALCSCYTAFHLCRISPQRGQDIDTLGRFSRSLLVGFPAAGRGGPGVQCFFYRNQSNGSNHYCARGLLLLRSYRRNNERFSLGLVTSSGSLGLLFPPSLPIILYGSSQGDIGKLFMVSSPGFSSCGLSASSPSSWGESGNWRLPLSQFQSFSWLSKSRLGIPIPLILAGIYSGSARPQKPRP